MISVKKMSFSWLRTGVKRPSIPKDARQAKARFCDARVLFDLPINLASTGAGKTRVITPPSISLNRSPGSYSSLANRLFAKNTVSLPTFSLTVPKSIQGFQQTARDIPPQLTVKVP